MRSVSASASGHAVASSAVERDDRGGEGLLDVAAAGAPAGEPGRPPVAVDEVEQRERHVQVVSTEGLGGDRARFLGRLGLRRARAEIAQGRDATRLDHLRRDLVDRRQDAADAARGRRIGNRTVGDREVGLFEEAVAV